MPARWCGPARRSRRPLAAAREWPAGPSLPRLIPGIRRSGGAGRVDRGAAPWCTGARAFPRSPPRRRPHAGNDATPRRAWRPSCPPRRPHPGTPGSDRWGVLRRHRDHCSTWSSLIHRPAPRKASVHSGTGDGYCREVVTDAMPSMQTTDGAYRRVVAGTIVALVGLAALLLLMLPFRSHLTIAARPWSLWSPSFSASSWAGSSRARWPRWPASCSTTSSSFLRTAPCGPCGSRTGLPWSSTWWWC